MLNSKEYVNDILNGDTCTYFKTGELRSKTLYVNGYKHGNEIWCYPNGEIKEIHPYESGFLNGILEEFDLSGSYLSKQSYKYGKRNGPSFFYRDGLVVKKLYKNGKRIPCD